MWITLWTLVHHAKVLIFYLLKKMDGGRLLRMAYPVYFIPLLENSSVMYPSVDI